VRPGSARLNLALDHHEPRLAHTNGPLEDDFYLFCERRARKGVPLPECNATVHGIMVDAYFEDHGLVVELDGDDNHRTPAQRRRERRREMILRAHGLQVVRYDPALLRSEPALVEADLLRALARRVGDLALAPAPQDPAGAESDRRDQDQSDQQRDPKLEEDEVDLDLVRIQDDEQDHVENGHADPDEPSQLLSGHRRQ
jgi:Protein of unknown function (DUF559)